MYFKTITKDDNIYIIFEVFLNFMMHLDWIEDYIGYAFL